MAYMYNSKEIRIQSPISSIQLGHVIIVEFLSTLTEMLRVLLRSSCHLLEIVLLLPLIEKSERVLFL